MKKIYIASSALLLTPFITFAATGNLGTLIDQIISYANRILVLMMGIAVVMFVFYIIKYYIKADADRTEGSKYVMYSLIGFFIILSFWGLVNILQNTFGLQNDTNRPSGWNSFTNIFPGGGSGSAPSGSNRVNSTINGSSNSGDFYNNTFLNGGSGTAPTGRPTTGTGGN